MTTTEPAGESLWLTTADGLRLEAELMVPATPIGAAVLTHPHPRHGGNMRSMVPGELIRALPALGIATLRFNFRGMGASEGAFEDGVGEQLDVVAAIDTLHEVVEGLPVVICGSSFGADTALSVNDTRLAGWCALAPPLRDEKIDRFAGVAASDRPKKLIVPERDQFRPPDAARPITSSWNNTSIHVIPGADHFFVGRLNLAIEACCEFVTGLL